MLSLFPQPNYITRSGNGKDFDLIIDKLPSNFQNYYQESLLAAEMVYSKRQGVLHLLYSGGVDSEYALSIFLKLGINIRPVIIKLNSEYNAHDIRYAFDFCESKNLSPIVIDIDFDNFVESGKLIEVSKVCQSEKYQLAATAYAAEKLDGTVLLGDGEPYIKLDVSTKLWNVEIYEYDYAITNYFETKGIYGLPHFNRCTPGMMAAFLSDDRMRELALNTHPGKLGSHSSKWIVYNRHSEFNLIERQKYTGYEQIEKSPIRSHPALAELSMIGQTWNGKYSKEYFTFVKELICQ